jgi:hypothetical protein
VAEIDDWQARVENGTDLSGTGTGDENQVRKIRPWWHTRTAQSEQEHDDAPAKNTSRKEKSPAAK